MSPDAIAAARSVHAYLDQARARCAQELHGSRRSALALVVEVVAEQARVPREHFLPARFAQFMVCAWALTDAQEQGDLSACGDWVGWALSATIEQGPGVKIELSRVDEFWTSRSVSSWPGFRPTLVVYFSAFYYYARRRMAMRHVGVAFWGAATQLLDALMAQPPNEIDPAEAFLGSSMLAWAAIEAPHWAQRLTPRVEEWVRNEALPPVVRSVFCQTLATSAGRFSQQPQDIWARWTLDKFGPYLTTAERVQMLATVFDASNEGDVDVILAAIDEHQAPLHRRLSPLAFAIESGFKADVIQAFVVRCLDAGRVDTALRGIARWHQASGGDDALDWRSVLVLSPFSQLGYLAICHECKQFVARDGQALLERMTRETNAFLGAALTVTHADNSDLRIPERPGVPDVTGGSDWFATQREAYCPVEPPDGFPGSQLMLPPVGNALQAVQLATWGVTWPIAASLTRPRSDRRPQMVALWSGGGSLTEALELEMVSSAFRAAGANVETFDPDGGTREDFLAAYQDPKYDIFWVASHGEFDHWSPRHVKLQINANGTSVSLEDLFGKLPAHASRRLLVLNVCDGARFEEIGMVPRVGLAAGLAGYQQATVSHLWPVLGFPSAAFGASLAHYLALGMSFFQAYVHALQAMRKASPAIADELQALYGRNFELLDRLRAREEDYMPLQFSGSAAFFQ